MSKLTVVSISELGVLLVANQVAAAAGGDTFKNEKPNVFLAVTNANAATRTITVTPNKSSTTTAGFGEVAKDPIVVTVAQNETKFIGPFAEVFNDINGEVEVTYDDETDVTVAPFKLEALR